MNLQIMLDELQEYKRPKNELMKFYIQERLTESLRTYYKQVNDSLKFYKQKDELRIIKNLGDK